jgi:hypothetical protein
LFCLAAWALVARKSADRANPTDPAADLAEHGAAHAADATMASIAEKVETPPLDTHPPEARWEALLPQGIGSGSSRSHQPQAQAVDLPGDSSRLPPRRPIQSR